MIIGDRLREMREEKKLSQGDIEKRTGLLRCYISRVENGHTVPAIETLEKLARALEVSLYHLFYDGEEPRQLPVTIPSDVLDKKSVEFAKRELSAHVSVTEAALELKEPKQFICDWTSKDVVHRGTGRATVRRRLKATRTYIDVEEELR